jgi:N-acyl-D-amino-acid deacylase
MHRRAFLTTTSLAALGCAVRGEAGGRAPIAEAFDREIVAFMKARSVPGGALAVVKDRRLVYARGYGLADRERGIEVKSDSLFRIASISKPITAVAAMKLVEDGVLELDRPAFDIVKLGVPGDARVAKITVRQLLHHTGGWDRGRSFDPMFRSRQIAKAAGVPSPPPLREIIRYMLAQPLQFDPGAEYAYSNFGYCVLGRIIEEVSGELYEKFVKQRILAPIGITRMQIGATLDGRQAPGEVRYYTRGDGSKPSVFDGEPDTPIPYGAFCLEAMDAHGGWIASAIDLARFAAALDDPARCPILKSETLAILYEAPAPPVSRNGDGALADRYYGCGWSVRPVARRGAANYWHDGSLPGTATLLVRRWDGLSWAVLFNQRSEDDTLPDAAIDRAMHRAADAVAEWPAHDLFGG